MSAVERQALRDRLRIELARSPDDSRVIYEGKPEELLEAGVAEPQMLQFPPCRQRSGKDEYGDWFMSSLRRDGTVRVIRHVGSALAGLAVGGRRWGGPSVAAKLADADTVVRAALARAQGRPEANA